jgi:spore maturation protein CgeB
MRILVVGDWHSELHEQAVFDAFVELGHQVEAFAWHPYFETGGDRGAFRSLVVRAQNRFLAGPAIRHLNCDLIAVARRFVPDLVFVYRGTHLWPTTIDALRKPASTGAAPTVVLGYNNDDPFAPRQPASLWRHFLAAVPRYDAVLAYREHNLSEYRSAGARRVYWLRSWFMPARNHPVPLDADDKARFDCDVVFVGHHENDGRTEMLEAVATAGIDLKLFGPGYEWDAILARSKALRHLSPVRLVWGSEYNKALCGAKIALCFLSKLNRDTYTRRCFEIPASGALMLSEYTDDLASLYTPGVEADYFRDADELVAKLRLYLGDESLRARVAVAGERRVREDGHDVVSRMRALLDWVAGWNATGARL